MKTKSVETIASNDEHVRLAIYDGDLSIGEAGAELLRLAQEQHIETRRRLDVERDRSYTLLTALNIGLSPSQSRLFALLAWRDRSVSIDALADCCTGPTDGHRLTATVVSQLASLRKRIAAHGYGIVREPGQRYRMTRLAP